MPLVSRTSILPFLVGIGIGVLFSYQFAVLTTTRQFQKHRDKIGGAPVEGQGQISDDHFHRDSVKTADDLVKKVRVLCWVLTHPGNLESRASPVQAIWGRKCDQLLFVSEQLEHNNTTQLKSPAGNATMPIFHVDEKFKGREHLTAKTMQAFQHIYEHHFNDAEWFLKVDDDTYVIVENLRYFLSSQNSSEPVYFGHHYQVIVEPQGYFSGGAGYVLSKEALRRFGTRKEGLCADDKGSEDAQIGRCMQYLGVRTGNSRDALNRTRFHSFRLQRHLDGGFPDWYLNNTSGGVNQGVDSISDYAITFHYFSPYEMQYMDFLLYHLRPYGIISGLQDLNRPD